MTVNDIPIPAIRVSLIGFASLALAACGQNNTEEAEPDIETSQEETGGSIIRPDADVTPVEAALEPLDLVIPMDGVEEDEMPDATRDAIAQLLDADQLGEGGAIILRGHSDSAGSDAANLRSSEARAATIREKLIEAGISEDRIEVIAFGEQNPIKPNARPDGSPNEAGRAANRRVEVHVDVPEQPAEPGETSTT